jgi:hypothetical protein
VADLLCRCLPVEAAAWLREVVAGVGTDEAFLGAWSGAGRRLGRTPVVLTGSEEEEAGLAFVPQRWGADECGRAVLLVAALEARPPERHQPLVEELYRTGELRERQALLRVLGALPDPARFCALAVDAVRTNALPELEALAGENPYPGRHFSEEAFNQMVLKCLFNGIALGRIIGLAARRTTELMRMVAAFAAERRAAGRVVPEDAALVLGGGDANASV